jgi:ribonuclease HI
VSSADNRATFVVYTDGGSEPNPGLGGWGAVILDPASGERRELSGGEDVTTNNRMEITAALRALEAIDAGAEVDLFTDSSYLRLGITQWLRRWKAEGWRVRGGEPVKNDDLWRELERAAQRHRVRWHWVKGHSGQELNERAHTLAAVEIARRREAAGKSGRVAAPVTAGAGAGREARAGGETPAPADVEVLLKLSCGSGRGAWAARLRRCFTEEVAGGEASGTTANRLELEAAATILAGVAPGAIVEWRGGSDYLRDGASKWLDGWKRRGYRTAAGEPVKNADVWRRLDGLLAGRTVRFAPAGDEDREAIAALELEIKRRLGRRR